jgi:hypothetical protein
MLQLPPFHATLTCNGRIGKQVMSVLSANGVASVQHYAPLHYLPFIARSRALLNKPSLDAAGFKSSHLRSMSHGQDVARGFGNYAHMTLDPQPRILKAKLGAGFPHFALSVPVASVEANTFSLCRYNVAMTTHPSVKARIARFNSVAVLKPQEFRWLKSYRLAASRVMWVIHSLLVPAFEKLPAEFLDEIRALRVDRQH